MGVPDERTQRPFILAPILPSQPLELGSRGKKMLLVGSRRVERGVFAADLGKCQIFRCDAQRGLSLSAPDHHASNDFARSGMLVLVNIGQRTCKGPGSGGKPPDAHMRPNMSLLRATWVRGTPRTAHLVEYTIAPILAMFHLTRGETSCRYFP